MSDAQTVSCENICVLNVEPSETAGYINVTVYNGDTTHINYPTIQVINDAGDTIGNPDAQFDLFGQMGGDTIVHMIPGTLPNGDFTGTVLVRDRIFDINCSFPYPMNCKLETQPVGCEHLTVTNIRVLDATVVVTVYNDCDDCFSGFQSPVYNEMIMIRTVAPFDTIASSNCYCLVSPEDNDTLTYQLYLLQPEIPPAGEFMISFRFICDSLSLDLPLSIKNEEPGKGIYAYPNPGSGFIYFNSAGEIIENISVYDSLGKFLKNCGNASNANLESLSDGIYFIRIKTNDQVRTVRYVKIN